MKAKKNPTKKNPKPLLKMVAEYIDPLGFYHVENFDDKNIQEVVSKLSRNECRVVAISYIATEPERKLWKMSLEDAVSKILEKVEWFMWRVANMLGTAIFLLAIFCFSMGVFLRNYDWNESILIGSFLRVLQNVPESCYPSKAIESDFKRYVDESVENLNATRK